MTSRTPQPALAVFFIVLFVSAIILGGVYPALSAGVSAQPEPPPEMEMLSDAAVLPRLVLIADPDPNPEPHIVLPPENASGSERTQNATFIVNYVGNWPSAAINAFDYAVSEYGWGGLISSNVPIQIQATWGPMDDGILGGAGPAILFPDPPNAPFTGTYYFIALANKLAGYDLSTGPDIIARFNSNYLNYWYFGVDGRTPSNRYDFVTTIMHEIAHGLGFAGSMQVGQDDDGYGCSSPIYGCLLYQYPVIYDRFTENKFGTSLLLFNNNSTELAIQLTTLNNLYFDSTNTRAVYNNNPIPLHSPITWASGSSYSHLHSDIVGQDNKLMTYSLGFGDVIHYPGPVALAMLTDIGWAVNSPVQTSTSTPTRTITPTPTRTVTPTPRFSPTPRNTPSVWRHLPSVLHRSFTPTPQAFSLSGMVRYRGSPISGIPLSLQKLDAGGNRTQITTTTTDTNGAYRFNSPPVLGAGESYYVQYQNNGLIPNYLWAWNTPRTWSGVTGPVVYAPFDIADIPLLEPEDFSSVNFPVTFSWQRRSAVVSDNYEYDVYDQGAFNPWFASNPLGYMGQYTLNSLPVDNVNPEGEPFLLGVPYVWEVWVYGPDGGYGVSLEYRQVTFGPARQGVELSPEELQRLVEQSRQMRLDFRR